MKQREFPFFLMMCSFVIIGCTSTLRQPGHFHQTIEGVKTIAVMPADVTVYQLTAGGMREEIDEWSDQAKANIHAALKTHFAEAYGFQIKFVENDWLKQNHKDLWKSNQALYNAIVLSALTHAFPGEHQFATKVKNFDYTLGDEVNALALITEGDALLFVYGFDHEETAGRSALWWWNLTLSLALGTDILPRNPSVLVIALVDGTSGDIVWFKTKESEMGTSFRNPKQVDSIVKWLTKDFLTENKD